jgi:hypothetical protein
VTANNTCGSSAPQTLAVTINPVPATPGTITGSANVCSGSVNNYSIIAVGGATSYTWNLPTGWSGSSSINSISATAGTSGGNITVTANNTCGSSAPQTLAVTINPVPATPGTITGSANVCSGSVNNYSITAVGGATSYTWTLPSGWSGTSTINSITSTAGASGGDITVTANNTCGSSAPQTLAGSINSIPATPGTITGATNVCSGISNNYSIVAVSGATSYTWTMPSGWSGSSTINSITTIPGTSGGNITVTANNTCGSSSPQTLAVTVTSAPAQPSAITGLSTPCSGATGLTYSVTNVAGVSYTWTVPSGWTLAGGQGTNSLLANAGITNGSICVSASNACGSSPQTCISVTASSIPGTPGPITGNIHICAGSSETYSISSVSGATTYTWSLPSGWAGSSTTESIVATAGTTSGSISVTAGNGCGTSAPRSLAVTVHNPSAPVITINLATLTSSYSSGNQWYFNGISISGATNQNYNVTQNGQYYVIYTDGYGCWVSSDTIDFVWVGVTENSKPENLVIYPNPGAGVFVIDWKGEEQGEWNISVYSSLGEMVYSKNINGQNKSLPVTIDLGAAAPGIYLLQAKTKNSLILHKLIVR